MLIPAKSRRFRVSFKLQEPDGVWNDLMGSDPGTPPPPVFMAALFFFMEPSIVLILCICSLSPSLFVLLSPGRSAFSWITSTCSSHLWVHRWDGFIVIQIVDQLSRIQEIWNFRCPHRTPAVNTVLFTTFDHFRCYLTDFISGFSTYLNHFISLATVF